MARRRYISTEISVDRRMNQLAKTGGDFAMLLYILMVPHADDAGTLTGDPEELLATVVPMRRDKSEEDVEAALSAMADLGLVEWDKKAGEVRLPAESFYKYQTYIKPENRRGAQKPERKQPAPKNPAPPQRTGEKPEERRESPESFDQRRKTPQNAASVSPSVTVTPTVSHTEGLAVEKHGAVPEAELPPPLDPEGWEEAGIQRTYPDADRLHEAFYSERYPAKLFDPNPTERAAARKVFVPMAESGITMAQVKQATAAALRRFRDRTQVTPAAIARNWSALLEDDPPPKPSPPSGNKPVDSRTRITQMLDGMQDRYEGRSYQA